jgi:hypothetical protein
VRHAVWGRDEGIGLVFIIASHSRRLPAGFDVSLIARHFLFRFEGEAPIGLVGNYREGQE